MARSAKAASRAMRCLTRFVLGGEVGDQRVGRCAKVRPRWGRRARRAGPPRPSGESPRPGRRAALLAGGASVRHRRRPGGRRGEQLGAGLRGSLHRRDRRQRLRDQPRLRAGDLAQHHPAGDAGRQRHRGDADEGDEQPCADAEACESHVCLHLVRMRKPDTVTDRVRPMAHGTSGELAKARRVQRWTEQHLGGSASAARASSGLPRC